MATTSQKYGVLERLNPHQPLELYPECGPGRAETDGLFLRATWLWLRRSLRLKTVSLVVGALNPCCQREIETRTQSGNLELSVGLIF